MKRLLLIAAAALAFVGQAHGLEDDFQSKTYRLNGKPVQVWTDSQMNVEMRFIPGWQLTCPQAQWGEGICNGGQGFLFFIGKVDGDGIHGEARTDKCPEMFPAYAERGKGGRVTIYRVLNADDGIARNSKCNVVLIPAKDPRDVPPVHPNPGKGQE
jgi:hypothetical protein